MRLRKIFSFFLLFTLLLGNFFYLSEPSKADSDKTVIITFASAPSPGSVNVTKADLKYNKDFALSYTFDDGYIEGYNPGFKYLHGGYVDELGEVVGGLYYSDGASRRVPFKGAFNWFSNGSVSFGDLHIDAPSNMTWDDLREAYALGWEPINHGWTSRYTPDPPDTIINYPEPHGPSPIDYDYEVSQNTLRLFEELGATIKHFGLPAGDDNYIPAAWSNGMKTISHGHPSSQNNYGLIDVSETLDFYQFEYMRTYFADENTSQDMKDYVDMIANSSINGEKYWGIAASHRVRTPVKPPDLGNLDFNNFKDFMDYVADTYGAGGDDSVWMASAPEVYEYLVSKQQTLISTNLESDTLTIELDDSGVDNDLRRYALSLIIEADTAIESISYGTDFTYHSDNKTTGLINLDWGFISLDNDLTRCEDLVSTAEASKSQVDVDTARSYVNLLDDSSEKTDFMDRLDDIEVNLTAWQVSFGENGYTSGSWNLYGANLTSHSSLTLNNVDNQISSTTLRIYQDFSSKSSSGQTADPADSGYFPDSYLTKMIRMYNSSDNTTPGAVRLGGLDIDKKYQVELMGSHTLIDANTDKTTTIYTVNGASQELQTSTNTDNVIIFNDISPDASGNIDVYVAKKHAHWGYGVLNALKLVEQRQFSINYQVGLNGSILGDVSQILNQGEDGSQVTAVADENYHFVNWSDGVLTATRSEASVSENISVTAHFAIDTYDVSYSAGSGGSITGTLNQTIDHGSSSSQVTAVADENYHFVNWSDGVLTATRSEASVSENISVTAHFVMDAPSGSVTIIAPKAVGSGGKDIILPFGGYKNLGVIDDKGINVFGYINSQADFEIQESSNPVKTSHSLEIMNLDLLTGILTLKVSSTPTTFSLEQGGSKKIDLDKDGCKDVLFTFADLYVNRVEITIKDINYDNCLDNKNNLDLSYQDTVFNKNNFLEQELLKLKPIDLNLSKRLKGRILLQVEDLGQAWYVEPVSLNRYYMQNGNEAYNIMKNLGIGISNIDLIRVKNDNDFAKKHQGKIFLQVEDLGQAYYIDFQGKAHYLKNGGSAYNIMSNLGLGIKNLDLYKINISE